MKKIKKVFAIGLSSIFCMSAMFSFPVNAIFRGIDGLSAPDGYVQFEDNGYYQDAANGWIDPPEPFAVPYVVYENPETGHIILAKNHMFNYVQFCVTEENIDAFEQIYAVYADSLNFDEEVKDESSGEIYYTYYDNKNADGVESCDPAEFEDKYDIIFELTQELKAADLLLEARYYCCVATGLEVDSTVGVTGITEENIDTVSEIVADYGGTLTPLEGDIYEYLITDVTTFETKMAVKEAVEAQISDVTVVLSTSVFETVDNLTLETDAIDLLTAEPDPDPPVATGTTTLSTGDIDGDGDITLQDAYQALVAYASASAGLELELTEEQQAAADVDGDGAITIADAFKILIYYATEAVGRTPSWD